MGACFSSDYTSNYYKLNNGVVYDYTCFANNCSGIIIHSHHMKVINTCAVTSDCIGVPTMLDHCTAFSDVDKEKRVPTNHNLQGVSSLIISYSATFPYQEVNDMIIDGTQNLYYTIIMTNPL